MIRKGINAHPWLAAAVIAALSICLTAASVAPDVMPGDAETENRRLGGESGVDPSHIDLREGSTTMTADIAAEAPIILTEWDGSELIDAADVQAELANIFPSAGFEQLEGHVHKVMENGELIGYAGFGAAAGYNDDIVVAVGIGLDRQIRGVHVVEHNETRGLGARVVEDDFLSQFEGLTLEQVGLSSADGQVDGVTGATVSSEAATKAVHEQVETLYGYLDQPGDGGEA